MGCVRVGTCVRLAVCLLVCLCPLVCVRGCVCALAHTRMSTHTSACSHAQGGFRFCSSPTKGNVTTKSQDVHQDNGPVLLNLLFFLCPLAYFLTCSSIAIELCKSAHGHCWRQSLATGIFHCFFVAFISWTLRFKAAVDGRYHQLPLITGRKVGLKL